MALVNCPECGKEVSDKAYSCPVCGFPVREHFEEIEEERIAEEEAIAQAKEEERRKKELEDRALSYSAKKNFHIADNDVSFTKNEAISITLNNEIRRSFRRANNIVEDFAAQHNETGNNLTRMNKKEYCDNRNLLLKLIIEEYWSFCVSMKRRFYIDKYASDIDLQDQFSKMIHEYDLPSQMDHIYNKGVDALTEQEDLANLNLSSYEFTINSDGFYDVSGTPGQIAGKILTKKFFQESARRAYKKELGNYAIESDKLSTTADALIYSVVSCKLEKMAMSVLDLVQTFLLDTGNLFIYTGEYISEDKIIEHAKALDNTETNNYFKKSIVAEGLQVNPTDVGFYEEFLRKVVFTPSEIKEIKRLLNFFEIEEEWIKKIFEECNSPVKAFFDDNITVEEAIRMAAVDALTYNGKVYSSIEEKENFIEEEKIRIEEEKKKRQRCNSEAKYIRRITDGFLASKKWYSRKFIDQFIAKVKENGEPEFEENKELYHSTVNKAKRLLAEINNPFIESNEITLDEWMDSARFMTAGDCYDDGKLTDFFRKENKSKCQEIKKLLEPEECVVTSFYGILVTTRKYIFLSDEKIKAAHYEEIDRIVIGINSSIKFIFTDGSSFLIKGIKFEDDKIIANRKILISFASRIIEQKNKEPERIRKIEEEKEIGLEIAKKNYIQNNLSNQKEFIYSFRKNWKCMCSLNKNEYSTFIRDDIFEYDYVESAYDRMPDSIQKKYKIKGEYILSAYWDKYENSREAVITDQALYIGDYRIELINREEIIRLNRYQHKQDLDGIVLSILKNGNYEIKDVLCIGSYHEILTDINIAFKNLRSNDYRRIVGKDNFNFTYCHKCNGIDTIGMFEKNIYRCQCGNTDNESMFESIRRKETLEKVDKSNLLECEVNKDVFAPEEEWLRYAEEWQVEIVKCPNCGQYYSNKQVKCINCGETNLFLEIECENCGKIIKKGVKFCNFCGETNLWYEEKCTFCGKKIRKGAKYCNSCGNLNASYEEKCIFCGKKIKNGTKFCNFCGKEQVRDNTSGGE